MVCGAKRLGFCFGSRSGAVLLHPDLIQNEGQAGDRCQEGTQDRSDQSVLAGQFTEAIQLIGGQDRAFDDTTLDGQSLQLVLLGELANDTSRGDGVAGGGSHGGSAAENLGEIVAGILGCEIGQGVLNNGILDACFAELLTQLGILSNSNTLVINEDHGSSFLNLAGQGIDNCLLALKNLCVGHEFSPPKNKKVSSCQKTERHANNHKSSAHLGRTYALRHLLSLATLI